MTELEVINKIREIEIKAASIIKKSHEEANKFIFGAKLKAKEILERQEIEAEAKSKRVIEQSQDKLKELLKKKEEGLASEKESLEKLAKKNFSEAVEFLKNRFFQKWQ